MATAIEQLHAALIPDIDPLSVAERLQWYEANLWIRPKKQKGVRTSSRLIPLKLNNIQEELEEYVVWCYQQGLPARVLALKARQEGVSTWTEGHIFLQTLILPQQQAFVVAHDEDATSNLRGMYYRYYENLDPENRPPTKTDNRRGLSFKHNQSEVFCFTAGKGKGGGRSFNPTQLHASEVDFWPDAKRLYDAMAQGIAYEPWTLVVFESTADGPHLMMNEMWDEASRGRNEYKPFFFGWQRFPEYQRGLSYTDLLRYAQTDWINRRRQIVEKSREERGDALAAGPRLLGHPGSEGDGATSGAVAGDPESRRGTESGTPPTDRASGQRGWRGVDVRGEGLPGGGRTPGTPAPFNFDLERGTRPAGDPGGGRVPVDDSPRVDPESRVWREVDGADPDSPLRRRVRGEADRAPGPDGQGAGEQGRALPDPVPSRLQPMGNVFGSTFDVRTLFADSRSPYEIGLQAEFDVTFEQLNWLRWCEANNCRRDPITRRREYPSRPEEAFQASSSEVLDLRVLAEWLKEAETYPKVQCSFLGWQNELTGERMVKPITHDPVGRVEIYEYPSPPSVKEYIMCCDVAQGVGEHDPERLDSEGDWHVGIVMDLFTGNQVAEYRSKDDPDIAVSQIEALAIYYHVETLAIETTGGHGVPFVRELLDRRTVPMYMRRVRSKITRDFTDKPGWNTGPDTRPSMISEMKLASRENRCVLRSYMTIREAMILTVHATGKVAAPKNHHDDGAMTWGICLVIRNERLSMRSARREADRSKSSHINRLNRQLDRMSKKKNSISQMSFRSPIKKKVVRPGPRIKPDGRRGTT